MDSQTQRSDKKPKEKSQQPFKKPSQPFQKPQRPIENTEDLSPNSHSISKPMDPKEQEKSLNMSFESNSLNNASENNNTTGVGSFSNRTNKVQKSHIIAKNSNNNDKTNKNTKNNVNLTPKNNKTQGNPLVNMKYNSNTSNIIGKIDKNSKNPIKPNEINIMEFYKKERGKINIWTYLFGMLNKAISDIYNMCEIEAKQEYAFGVLETLENSSQDFKKLIHRLKVETIETPRGKGVAWELSNVNNTMVDIPNKAELETFIEDLEEPETVDFTLLTQLVNEQKMTFDEAIVLLIRERALLIDDPLLSLQGTSQTSNNNSFISKYSSEFLDALKEFKDDSNLMENEGNHRHLENLENKRSRSTTPSRISLARLMSKLNWRLINNLGFSIKEEDENNCDDKKDILEEKLTRAESLRKALELHKQSFLQKEKEKFVAARKRLEMKKLEKDRINSTITKKMDEADQRYEAHIHSIKHRARNQISKTHEIAFITMLETQTKKVVLDEKLNECRERKIKIMSNMKQRLYERSLRETAVEKRRLAQIQEIEEQRKSHQIKLEEAENRRLRILEEKRKHFEELNKEKKIVVSERKKSQITPKLKSNAKEKLKQKLLKDKDRLDKIFSLVSSSHKNLMSSNLKTINETDSSSFITIEDSDDASSSAYQYNDFTKKHRKIKMNSLDNSREFNLCFDEDISIDNSILFYDPKAVQDKTLKSTVESKEKSIKTKKKQKKTKKNKESSVKAERFMTIPSCSMPNLKYRRDLMLNIKPKKTKNIYLRLSKDGTLCKAKISVIYPQKHIKHEEKASIAPLNPPPPISPIFMDIELKPIEANTETSDKNSKKPKKSLINPSLSTINNSKEETKSNTNENLPPNQTINNIVNSETSNIRWCQLCNLILSDDISNIDHLSTKTHKKFRGLYGLSQTEDIITFQSGDPGNEELKAERLNAYKKRCKKIKQTMASKALKHETAAIIGKESSSPNKQRLQKLCIELEKQILPQIKDYAFLENLLKDSIKLLEQRREADLHIMRQLKFVPMLMEICKKLSMCHRNEINEILKILDFSSNLLSLFCGLVDNRTYMLITNRLIPLVDLLLWCLNRPTKFVYSLGFVPVLFNIITTHLKHRLTPDRIAFKEYLIEYIFSSGFLLKIKQKFMSFTGGLDLSTCMGKVPLALLKSLNFIEMLTNYLGIEVSNKPVFEQYKINESITFMLKQSDLIGIINLLVSMLLSEGSYGKIPGKILPQTVLTLTMVSLKFLNNVARLNLDLLQKCTCSKINEDSVYHVFNYLLTYCKENYDTSDDIKDLLNELILLIGYNSLLNEKSQEMLGRGEQTIMQKLAGLPFSYICDKKLKEVLFPSLISCIFKNERNLKIILQEYSKELLIIYLNSQIQQFPYEKPLVHSTTHKTAETSVVIIEKSEKSEKNIEKLEKNEKSEKNIEKLEKTEKIEKTLEKQEKSLTFEKLPSLTQIEEKKDEDPPEESIYSNYIRYVRDSQMKNEKKGARSLSISSTNSSQNNCLISASQHFCFPLRFPRQLWEDVVEFINNVSEQQG